MLKEYTSRWNCLGLRLNINGVSIPIQFSMKRDGGSYYVTTDKDIMSALESNKRFNVDYSLFRTENQTIAIDNTGTLENFIPLEVLKDPLRAAQNGELEEIKVIEEVVNITQAREYLKKIGVDYHKLNTPNSIITQAQNNNIEFPNLKI